MEVARDLVGELVHLRDVAPVQGVEHLHDLAHDHLPDLATIAMSWWSTAASTSLLRFLLDAVGPFSIALVILHTESV